MGWFGRLRNTVRRSSADTDFDAEVRFHFDQCVDDYIKQGLSREEAISAASRRLGNLTLTSEQTHDADTVHWLADFAADVGYGLRTLRKQPAFATIAILTLGLGVGLNTATFIFYDALVFRPPNVPRPRQLVRIFTGTTDTPHGKVAYPDYLDVAGRATTLAGTVAFDDALSVAVSRHQDEPRQVVGAAIVSGNLFSVLGVGVALGRGLHDQDDRPGADAVVVISHKLWERLFQSDPSAIGAVMSVAKGQFTVIGVTRAQASHVMAIEPDVFIAAALNPIVARRED